MYIRQVPSRRQIWNNTLCMKDMPLCIWTLHLGLMAWAHGYPETLSINMLFIFISQKIENIMNDLVGIEAWLIDVSQNQLLAKENVLMTHTPTQYWEDNSSRHHMLRSTFTESYINFMNEQIDHPKQIFRKKTRSASCSEPKLSASDYIKGYSAPAWNDKLDIHVI